MGAQILSKSEIIEAVRRGEIKISYYCYRDQDGDIQKREKGIQRHIQYFDESFKEPEMDDEDYIPYQMWSFFLSQLEPDSLKLTTGPLAYVSGRSIVSRILKSKTLDRRTLSSSVSNMLDVWEEGKLNIHPGESMLVATNEGVSVSSSIGGSLYATVRNTDVGFSHVSTTIDPGWKGKLQIGFVNATKIRQELNILDPICKVRFHRFDTPTEVGNTISEKAHYDTGYHKIPKNGGSYLQNNVFPMRKEQISSLDWEHRRAAIVNLSKLFIKLSIFFTAFFAAFDFWLSTQISKGVAPIEQRIKEVEFYNKVNSPKPWLHTTNITLNGSHSVSFPVAFSHPMKNRPFIATRIEDSDTPIPEYLYQTELAWGEKKEANGEVYYDSAIVTIRFHSIPPKMSKKMVAQVMVISSSWDGPKKK